MRAGAFAHFDDGYVREALGVKHDVPEAAGHILALQLAQRNALEVRAKAGDGLKR
jgi:hypothetical protein